jgi:hypothetical protein
MRGPLDQQVEDDDGNASNASHGSGGEGMEPSRASDNGSSEKDGGPYNRDQNILPLPSTSCVHHVTSDPGCAQQQQQDIQISMLLGETATTIVTGVFCNINAPAADLNQIDIANNLRESVPAVAVLTKNCMSRGTEEEKNKATRSNTEYVQVEQAVASLGASVVRNSDRVIGIFQSQEHQTFNQRLLINQFKELSDCIDTNEKNQKTEMQETILKVMMILKDVVIAAIVNFVLKLTVTMFMILPINRIKCIQ